MKLKNYFLGMLVYLLLFSTVSAQEHDRTMALSISPIAVIGGSADLLYQVKLTDFMALTVPAHFSYNWPLGLILGLADKASLGKLKATKSPLSVGGGLGLRFTPFSKVFEDSFYLEPRMTIDYSQFEATFKDEDKLGWQLTKLTPKLKFGWDWYYDSGFLLSIGAGIGYAFTVQNKYEVPGGNAGKAISTASRWIPGLFPSKEGQIVYDLEFKLGYSW